MIATTQFRKLKGAIKPRVFSLATFIILALAGSYATYLSYTIARENQQREMVYILYSIEKNIDQALKQGYAAALTISMTIENDGVPNNFDSVAAQVMKTTSILEAVELVPDGVIKYIYPLDGNRAAMGYDILEDTSRNKEAYQAMQTRQMFYAGPLQLKQGGVAVVGRLPIFLRNKFWGFSAVLIDLEKLLQFSGITESEKQGFVLQFSKIDPNTGQEEFYLPQTKSFSTAYSETITFPEGNWTLYITPNDPESILWSVLPLALTCLIISLAGANFIYGLVNRPIELEKKLAKRSDELVKSERNFRTIFQQTAMGIAQVNVESKRFIEVNKRFSQLSGYNQAEIRHLTFLDISHEDDKKISGKKVEDMKSGKIRNFSLEKRIIRKDGKSVWVRVAVSPLWKKEGPPSNYIAVIEDISEQKEFQQKILESSLQAQEAEKNRIASELHDGIVQEIVACGIQCENLINMVPGQGEIFDRIQQLSNLIKKITFDTRNLSHNLLSADMDHMSLSVLLERLQHQLKSLSAIELRVDNFLDDVVEVPGEVKINLYRAIQELTTNVVKHSRATFAVISVEKIRKEIFVSVQDNGIGMRAEERVEGIGSYNVRNRIYKIGGSIEYQQPEEGGLQVNISIPLA